MPCAPDLTAELRLMPSSAPPCSFTGVCAPTDSRLLTTVTAFVPSFTSNICICMTNVMHSNVLSTFTAMLGGKIRSALPHRGWCRSEVPGALYLCVNDACCAAVTVS